MEHPAVQRHDRRESQRGLGLGCRGRQGPSVSVLIAPIGLPEAPCRGSADVGGFGTSQAELNPGCGLAARHVTGAINKINKEPGWRTEAEVGLLSVSQRWGVSRRLSYSSSFLTHETRPNTDTYVNSLPQCHRIWPGNILKLKQWHFISRLHPSEQCRCVKSVTWS